MSLNSCACCAAILNQQREQQMHQHQQAADAQLNQGKQKPKNCTVVENGRVVVKPLPVEGSDESSDEATHSKDTTL